MLNRFKAQRIKLLKYDSESASVHAIHEISTYNLLLVVYPVLKRLELKVILKLYRTRFI